MFFLFYTEYPQTGETTRLPTLIFPNGRQNRFFLVVDVLADKLGYRLLVPIFDAVVNLVMLQIQLLVASFIFQIFQAVAVHLLPQVA